MNELSSSYIRALRAREVAGPQRRSRIPLWALVVAACVIGLVVFEVVRHG